MPVYELGVITHINGKAIKIEAKEKDCMRRRNVS